MSLTKLRESEDAKKQDKEKRQLLKQRRDSVISKIQRQWERARLRIECTEIREQDFSSTSYNSKIYDFSHSLLILDTFIFTPFHISPISLLSPYSTA